MLAHLLNAAYVKEEGKIITSQWIPTHCGKERNEKDETIANEAAQIGHEEETGLFLEISRSSAELTISQLWTERWLFGNIGRTFFNVEKE